MIYELVMIGLVTSIMIIWATSDIIGMVKERRLKRLLMLYYLTHKGE